MEKIPRNMPLRRGLAVPGTESPYSRLPRPLARVTVHVPVRPNWVCAGCGARWPCRTRRGQLLAEFDRAPVSLALLMGGYFMDAAQDLPTEPASVLYGRFMGWLKEQPEPDGDQDP
jgi:hypothetical protein